MPRDTLPMINKSRAGKLSIANGCPTCRCLWYDNKLTITTFTVKHSRTTNGYFKKFGGALLSDSTDYRMCTLGHEFLDPFLT